MKDITFSCMLGENSLRLDDFEPRPGVHTQRMDWADAWDELMRIALYSQGPDVSEIGSTWLSSLIEMDALRPLTAWNLSFLHSLEGFFPAAGCGHDECSHSLAVGSLSKHLP